MYTCCCCDRAVLAATYLSFTKLNGEVDAGLFCMKCTDTIKSHCAVFSRRLHVSLRWKRPGAQFLATRTGLLLPLAKIIQNFLSPRCSCHTMLEVNLATVLQLRALLWKATEAAFVRGPSGQHGTYHDSETFFSKVLPSACNRFDSVNWFEMPKFTASRKAKLIREVRRLENKIQRKRAKLDSCQDDEEDECSFARWSE